MNDGVGLFFALLLTCVTVTLGALAVDSWAKAQAQHSKAIQCVIDNGHMEGGQCFMPVS